MRKFILLLTFLLFVTSLYAQPDYYDQLKKQCQSKSSVRCCLASVDAMEKSGYKLVAMDRIENHGCPLGYIVTGLRCVDSFGWCQPDSAFQLYFASPSYCAKDQDCAVREGVCGPEAMNIYYDISVFDKMKPFVECAERQNFINVRCEDSKCVADVEVRE